MRCRQNQPYALYLLAFSTVITIAFLTISRATAKVLPEPVQIIPVVLTLNDALSGCGIQADYQTGKSKVSVSIVALRAQTAVRFSLKVTWMDLTQADRQPATVMLKSGTHNSTQLFPKPSQVADHTIETSARLDGLKGASFIQSIMISGASIVLTDADQKTLPLNLPGPVPHLVRASYLNCSGDLFRPVGETRGENPTTE